jgi:flagella basal body P-ring formation protein FlgA
MTSFKMLPCVWAPRDNAYAYGSHFTPFFAIPGIAEYYVALSLGLSCPPRSLVRSRLGEGRIRNLFYGIRCFLFLGFILFAAAPTMRASDRLVINLKEDATIEAANILLKDIAELRGPDSDLLDRLAHVSLGATPAFGDRVYLSRNLIGEIIEKTVGGISADSFAGASVVQIRLLGRHINEEELAALIKKHLLETTSWNESELVIRSIGNAKGIEIPPVKSELRVLPNAALMGQRSISIPVEVSCDGKSLRNFWVTAQVAIRAEVLIASNKIPSGRVITSQDVIKQTVEISDLRGSYYRELDDIVGKVSRRIFSSGDLLTRESFTEPLLVKTGETVRLRLERDGIVLTSLAKAEQDGKLGQMIRVRNIDYSTLLKAQVTGRAEVKLQ